MIMKKSFVLKSLLLAAVLPVVAGCVVYRDRPAPPPGEVGTANPGQPPPLQADVIVAAPGPLNLWLWVPGCWEWRGHWVWHGGHWAARPHPGAVWVGPHWGWHRHHRVWIGGTWR